MTSCGGDYKCYSKNPTIFPYWSKICDGLHDPSLSESSSSDSSEDGAFGRAVSDGPSESPEEMAKKRLAEVFKGAEEEELNERLVRLLEEVQRMG